MRIRLQTAIYYISFARNPTTCSLDQEIRILFSHVRVCEAGSRWESGCYSKVFPIENALKIHTFN